MKTVAVFFGGKSNEHEISVITGLLAVNLLREKYRVVPVYLSQSGEWYSSEKMRSVDDLKSVSSDYPRVALEGRTLVLHKKRKKKAAVIDVALNCCHGGEGEDGTLSALLDFHGVPFASPSLSVSSVFMNKELGKIAAKGLCIPVVESISVSESDWAEREQEIMEKVQTFGFPVIVKPVHLGSSIGIKVAQNAAEFAAALRLAFRLDSSAVVERYLAGKRDINCAAYRKDGKIVLSPCEEVFSEQEILSFSEKYEGTGSRNSAFPAELPEGLAEEIQSYVKTLYETFGVCGVVRADFLVQDDKVYFNELNTVPGSLACYLFGESLSENRDFLVSLVEEVKPRHEKERVVTGILRSTVFSGAKGCKRR